MPGHFVKNRLRPPRRVSLHPVRQGAAGQRPPGRSSKRRNPLCRYTYGPERTYRLGRLNRLST
eukprot:9173278-Lingulodinium_polyedra.AAC.1